MPYAVQNLSESEMQLLWASVGATLHSKKKTLQDLKKSMQG